MNGAIVFRCKAVSIMLGLLLLSVASPVLSADYDREVTKITFEMAAKINSAGRKTIAVVDFADLQGNVTELGRFLAEEVSIALAGAGNGFAIVDRSNLANILKEHKLSATGIIDPNTTRQLGRIAGVEALITGSLTPFGDSVRLSIKIVDTESAKMIGSASADIAKIGAIEELLSKGITAETGPVTARASKPKTASVVRQSVEQQKFIFELQGCELSGQNISCTFLVMNQGKDRNLAINKASKLIDDQGNDYSPSLIQVANTTMERYNDTVNKTLIYGVPVRTDLSFPGISPQATRVASLILYGESEGVHFQVSFRDVSLEQKSVPVIPVSLSSLVTGEMGTADAPAPGAEQQEKGLVDTAADALGQEVTNYTKKKLKSLGLKLLKKVIPVPVP